MQTHTYIDTHMPTHAHLTTREDLTKPFSWKLGKCIVERLSNYFLYVKSNLFAINYCWSHCMLMYKNDIHLRPNNRGSNKGISKQTFLLYVLLYMHKARRYIFVVYLTISLEWVWMSFLASSFSSFRVVSLASYFAHPTMFCHCLRI